MVGEVAGEIAGDVAGMTVQKKGEGIAWYDPAKMGATGRKNGKANAARHCIEGETVTVRQIAERIGCTRDQASSRLDRERRKDGRVTWQGLRA